MQDSHRRLKFLVLLALTAGLVALLPVAVDRENMGRPWAQPVAAVALNFAVSGWIVLLNKVLQLPPLPVGRNALPGERRLYEALGIRVFKRFLRFRWYSSIWGPSLRRDAKAVSLQALTSDMRSSEVAHAAAFVLVCLLTVFVLATGRGLAALWLLVCNILINAYPVMLQRYNRQRIARMTD
jgi:hypothetical protein